MGSVVSKSSVPVLQKKVFDRFEATGASETVRHKLKSHYPPSLFVKLLESFNMT